MPEQPHDGPRVGRLAVFALLLVAFHLGWFFYFVPPATWWTDTPIPGVDFETHVSQTWRFLEAMDGWGRSWLYDPRLLAGYPHGVIFDADNKGWEVWTWALRGLGLSAGFAFNTFVALAHLGVLLVVYTSARLFRLGRAGALVAAAFASLIWFFDSFSHWCWWIGMVAYAIAGYLGLLPLALFYRWLHDRRTWQAIACAVTLALAHLLHPYVFVVLVAPMLALYARHARGLGARGHLAVLGIVGLTVAVNAWWLGLAARYWHYILDSGYFGQSGPTWVAADFLGLLRDTATSGLIGTRTGFRFLALGTATVALWQWRRARDPRYLPFVVAIAAMAVLAYLSGYIWLFRQIQPYRHVLPLAFFAVIPAAAAVEAAIINKSWRTWPRSATVALALLALPAAQLFAREILYFTPGLYPEVAPLYSGEWQPLTASGYPQHPDYRLQPATDEHEALANWVRKVDDGRSRFLIEEPAVGERLHWQTDAQIVGGFMYRNLQHSMANLFRRRKQGVAGDDELRTYFETYAIGHVIISGRQTWWDRRPAIVTPVTKIGHHRIYRTTIEPHLIQRGGGELTARPNELTVTGSSPDVDLVLRMHWHEDLVCEPGCTIAREPIDGFDPVGFIRVPAPHPTDLVIRNRYGEAGA
jgi:hypothetical protein